MTRPAPMADGTLAALAEVIREALREQFGSYSPAPHVADRIAAAVAAHMLGEAAVETSARAMYDNLRTDPRFSRMLTWPNADEHARDSYRHQARAAIRAAVGGEGGER